MQNKNNIDELREHLFDALRGLKNKTMDISTAQAMSDVSQTIIASARVEVEFAKATGEGLESKFLENTAEEKELPKGITAIRQHRIA